MNLLSSINAVVAGIIGLITAVVSWRVLRKGMEIDSPLLAICIGALTGLGLATQMGGTMGALLIPYEALGIAVVVLFLLIPFLKCKNDKSKKPSGVKPSARTVNEPEDPWEKEIRLRGSVDRKHARKSG